MTIRTTSAVNLQCGSYYLYAEVTVQRPISVGGATACIDCVAGKYLDTEGNDAETDCVLCARGTYSSALGVSVCLDCVSGKYVDTEGNDVEHADNAVILSSRGNQGCTNLDCPRLGLMAALLLMTIQWVGLTRRVGQWRKGKAGAYKARRNFALVFLLLVAQAEMVHTEPRYQCSSRSDCTFPGCNDVPCASNSPGCVNGIWTNWQCHKFNRYTAQSCVEGMCGCFYGEYDSIQLYTGVCPGRPCLNGTYGALGDGFQKWIGPNWGPRSTCTPCEAGKTPPSLCSSPSLPPSFLLFPSSLALRVLQRQGTHFRGSMGGVAARAAVVAAVVYYDHMPTAMAVSLPHYLTYLSTSRPASIFSSGCRAESLSSSSMIRNTHHADAAAAGGGGWQANTRARKFGTANLVNYLMELETCTVLSLMAA